MISQLEARRLFIYDQHTGALTWRIKRKGGLGIGKRAGTLDSRGYYVVCVDGKKLPVHRVIWVYVNGEINGDICHENGIPSDNRLSNLMDRSHAENMKNLKIARNNTSGHIGVTWNKRAGKWLVMIKVNRESIYLGYYSDINDAASARKAAEKAYGFHENHGLRLQAQAAK